MIDYNIDIRTIYRAGLGMTDGGIWKVMVYDGEWRCVQETTDEKIARNDYEELVRKINEQAKELSNDDINYEVKRTSGGDTIIGREILTGRYVEAKKDEADIKGCINQLGELIDKMKSVVDRMSKILYN